MLVGWQCAVMHATVKESGLFVSAVLPELVQLCTVPFACCLELPSASPAALSPPFV